MELLLVAAAVVASLGTGLLAAAGLLHVTLHLIARGARA